MKHLGDFDASSVIYGKFTTFRPSTGAPYTLAGTPALSVYKDNSTTQSTTGVTLTVDFDSVTGLHHFAIDTSADGTFYATGSFFDIVITTGTVDGVSVVGTVVASFTLRKTAALKPTTAGRTLDVSAGGEAGIDWANVGSPTTTVGLSGTTISTSQAVASVSGAVGSVTGNVGGSVATVTALASGAITEAAFATTAGSFAPLGIVDQGTAQAATSTTLQLRSAAAFADGELVGCVVVITSASTGAGQARAITGYTGSTDTATVDAWTTTPTGTITYKVFASPTAPASSAAAIAAAVFDLGRSGHTTAGTFGEALNGLFTTLEAASGSPGDFRFAADALINAPTGGLTAAGVRAAIGMSSANLDTQLAAIDDYVDTEVAAIKLVTDKLGTMVIAAVGSPGDYAFAADALRYAPTGSGGGGGGGTDWSDGEREQIRYRLGIDGAASAPSATPTLATQATVSAMSSNLTAVKTVTDKLDTTVEVSGSPGDYRFTDEALVKAEDVILNAQRSAHRTGGSVGEAIYDIDIRGRRTVIYGTVGNATTPSTTQFTPSALDVAGVDADQFIGRIVVFDRDTSTPALRGQATRITASSAASLPLLTFDALTTAPSSGDTFSIV